MPTIDYDASREALYSPEKAPSVFARGLACTPLQLGVEGARLAYWRAEDGAAAFQRLADALALQGFQAPQLFAHAGSQAFGAWHPEDGTALVCFRGTQPDELADLASDLQAHMTDWTEAGGRVHSGFAQAARGLLPAIAHWLELACPRRTQLLLSGHSLGAALATLAASVWRPSLLVTLGSPRVGDPAFVQTLAGQQGVRLVNCCDVITRLPPELPFYTHLGPPAYITHQGVLAGAIDAAGIQQDRLAGQARYLAEQAWRVGAVLVRDLADHAPVNYVRAFF